MGLRTLIQTVVQGYRVIEKERLKGPRALEVSG